ncbi:MAG: sugar kinase [Rhodocyclaceae bacterium]|nr:sugar kinase [Rhodocyclaceae bacterium]
MAGSDHEPGFDIVSLGEAMVEFNQTGRTDDDRGGRLYLQGFGGDTSNFAIAAARQGARVAYVSALGDDPYGRLLREIWDAEGVDHAGVKTDAAACTAAYFVTHDAAGHHFSFLRNGSAASRLTPADLPHERIGAARMLHLSGITLAISTSACDTAYAAIDCARRAGVAVSFDTNLRLKLWPIDRARAVISDVIAHCDLCLPSIDDIAAITGLTQPDALIDHCLRLGAKTVALKLGDRGAIVADASGRHRIAPYPCRPVDATGAGDTFGGAFVARRIAGDDLVTAGRYAAAAAALSTEGFGAVEPIPTAARVRAALDVAPDPGAAISSLNHPGDRS